MKKSHSMSNEKGDIVQITGEAGILRIAVSVNGQQVAFETTDQGDVKGFARACGGARDTEAK